MKNFLFVLMILSLTSCATVVKTSSSVKETVYQYVEFDSVEAVNKYLANHPAGVCRIENVEYSNGSHTVDSDGAGLREAPVVTPVSRGDKIVYVMRVVDTRWREQSIKLTNGDIVRPCGNEPVVVLCLDATNWFYVKAIVSGGDVVEVHRVCRYGGSDSIQKVLEFIKTEYHSKTIWLDRTVWRIAMFRNKVEFELE